jgi:hypothetical protein
MKADVGQKQVQFKCLLSTASNENDSAGYAGIQYPRQQEFIRANGTARKKYNRIASG